MNALDVVVSAVRRARIVTVTGPSGTARSLVAQRAAPQLVRDQAGGGKLIELHQLEYPAELLAELSYALDMPPAPLGREQATAYVRIGLMDRAPTLFVLDGLDDLLPRCHALLFALINAAPQHRWLLTAAGPIGLRDEKVVSLSRRRPAPPVLATGPAAVRLQA